MSNMFRLFRFAIDATQCYIPMAFNTQLCLCEVPFQYNTAFAIVRCCKQIHFLSFTIWGFFL